jgi:protein-S-isoprenylcysteine O-methyltransferase Ste14
VTVHPLVEQMPLLLVWIAYATIHSLLAADAVKNAVGRRWPALHHRYRLFYNLLATALLAPIAWIVYALPGPKIWAWSGALAWLANGIALSAVVALLAFPTGYDTRAFAGLAPEPPAFVIGPWHRIVRHPWYFVGLVVVWTRDMTLATLVSAIAISLYFIVGSRLEEAKLARVLGAPYREYLRRVPGLVPLPWRILDKETARRLARRPE